MLDPRIRDIFIESLGLCTYHAWLLFDTAERLYDKLGVSILYLDALRNYISNLENIAKSSEDPSSRCFMCKYVEDAESRYIKLYRECINADDYRRSPSTFCLKHLRSILEGKEENEKKLILEIHGEKLKKIEEKLSKYIAKYSYDNKEPITAEEAEAVEQAINSLKGLKTCVNVALRKHLSKERSATRRIKLILSKAYGRIHEVVFSSHTSSRDQMDS